MHVVKRVEMSHVSAEVTRRANTLLYYTRRPIPGCLVARCDLCPMAKHPTAHLPRVSLVKATSRGG